jgi:response regulator of citrate/malate metabolism
VGLIPNASQACNLFILFFITVWLWDQFLKNGFLLDLIEHLKKEHLVESKNIVIFTASSVNNELFDDLMKIGVKAILKKPVDMNARRINSKI